VSYLFPSRTITFDAALRDVASGSPKARAMAAHALGDVTDPVEKRRALDALVRALDDDRAEVRAEACGSLGTLGEPSALPHLLKRLDDGIPEVRQNAAIALGTLALPEGFEPLALALREGPADLRFQAATSLAEIDAARAFAPLLAALGDRDPQVVAAAALSLGAIGEPRAIESLRPLLEHADKGARFDAAYALAELKDAGGRPALAASLDDEERAWDAVTALGWLDARDELTAAATGAKTPPEAAVLAAGHLLRLGDDAGRAGIHAGLKSRKGHVRALAVEQLAAHGGMWAKPALEKLARSGKGADLGTQIAGALRAIEERGP
jgi:HEAT repeat protein